MNCWKCKSEMIWGGDNSFEECGEEGEGIISNFSCSNSDCQVTAEVRDPINCDEVLLKVKAGLSLQVSKLKQYIYKGDTDVWIKSECYSL